MPALGTPQLSPVCKARNVAFNQSSFLVDLFIGLCRQALTGENCERETIVSKSDDLLIKVDTNLAIKPFGERRFGCPPSSLSDVRRIKVKRPGAGVREQVVLLGIHTWFELLETIREEAVANVLSSAHHYGHRIWTALRGPDCGRCERALR